LRLPVGLGAFHALTPGHGKTVMAAYLVGTRRTHRQALFLALSVALSHTAGVLGLAVLTLAGSAVLAPERAYPYLSTASGAVVVALGAWMVATRFRHAHAHRHAHEHERPTTALGWRSLATLGLAGGLVPSASALVLLLGAISLHRSELGLVLVVAFGVGMAAVLVGVGQALVGARGLAERRLAEHRRFRAAVAVPPSRGPACRTRARRPSRSRSTARAARRRAAKGRRTRRASPSSARSRRSRRPSRGRRS